jgi:lysophospholipid hydrolase
VILTRFSRVTFNAAHRYLGLTKEVLRTEKAINEIACHPLPASFYEGGGLQYLRQRFDTAGTRVQGDRDYRSPSHSRIPSSIGSFHMTSLLDSPVLERPPFKMMTPRQLVQAGDLHSSTGHPPDSFHPLSRSFSIISTSGILRPGLEPEKPEDFDLREEVMSCIAKSIGLLQPPLSGTDSDEASPALPASDGTKTLFTSPYGSLSLLEMADDSSSVNGGLPAVNTALMSGLDNDVEILYFAAGSTLVKAGERNAGKHHEVRCPLSDILFQAYFLSLMGSWTFCCLWENIAITMLVDQSIMGGILPKVKALKRKSYFLL